MNLRLLRSFLEKRATLFVGLILVLILAGFISYPYFLNAMADFLVVQDKLSKADVIIVLAGDDNGERVGEGVRLYRQGYAKYLLMTGGPLAWGLTHAQNMKEQANYLGVPDKAIILEDKARSTIENAEFTFSIIKANSFKSIILVTSPYHTRRALRTFKKAFGKEHKIMVFPVQKSSFNPHDWWKRHEDTQLVIYEYLSLANYFLKGY